MYFTRIISVLAAVAVAAALNLPTPPLPQDHHSVDATGQVGQRDNLDSSTDFCWCVQSNFTTDDGRTSTCCQIANGTYDGTACHFELFDKQAMFDTCCVLANEYHLCAGREAVASNISQPPPPPPPVRREDAAAQSDCVCAQLSLMTDRGVTGKCCGKSKGAKFDGDACHNVSDNDGFKACCSASNEMGLCG